MTSADQAEASLATLARGSKSFHLASLLLPPAARVDAALVYTFCRCVDDLADDAPSPERGKADLADVRDEIDGRRAARPAVQGLLEVAARAGLDLGAARDLVDTCASDLDGVRVPDDDALVRYAYGVAGTVGLMMCSVIGVAAPEARAYAIDLGVAMQITNICRDVAEDARMGRVYLPEARLVAAGTTTEAVRSGVAPRAAIVAVVRDLLALADQRYEASLDGMRFIPWRPRLGILAASRVYRGIGARLLAVHGADPTHGRTVVPTLRRLVHVGEALGLAVHPRTWGGAPLRPALTAAAR